MNILEAYENKAAEEFARAIDWQIISELLVDSGWTVITARNIIYTGTDEAKLENWLSENISGQYRNYGRDWLFKDSGDAVLFALRWA